MARPFWSGHIQISLVSFGIEMFPATQAKGEIHFHQLSRKTGERIRHQNVSSDDNPVDKEDIVKGYEYSKGEYVMIEPEDIENLRIPSRNTLDVTTFVAMEELDPRFFEKPYFIVPENPAQSEAFVVVRKALQSTGKVGLGKIAFGGREHLIAISAPKDDTQLGIMGYLMRYADELRDPAEYFADIRKIEIDGDQLALAQELIKRRSAKFDPGKFTDDYEKALRAMVEAKVSHAPANVDAPAAKPANVLNLMDALRKSVNSDAVKPQKTPTAKTSKSSQKITVMKPTGRAKPPAKRRSA